MILAYNITENISLNSALLCLFFTAIIGVTFASFYAFSKRKTGFDYSFITSLIIIPIIVGIIIMLVSNDIVKAFSLGGVFVLIRFRTRIKDIKDAAYLFSVICIGFSCGLEYHIFSIIIAVFLLIILSILHLIKLDEPKKNTFRLKILLPENLDYVNLFDDIFTEYLKSSSLKKVKLTDFGSLIELTYIIQFKESNKQKEFIDKIRQRNGNMNILIADDYEKLLDSTK